MWPKLTCFLYKNILMINHIEKVPVVCLLNNESIIFNSKQIRTIPALRQVVLSYKKGVYSVDCKPVCNSLHLRWPVWSYLEWSLISMFT